MTADIGSRSAEDVFSGLKDFQRRTAQRAFERLFTAPDSTRRFLIADEVGLGKTLVATGVVALAIEHLRAVKTPRIDVIYICSNQAIARQNIERIQHHLGIETQALESRITLLPYQLKTLDRPVNLIALTPGTSFNSGSAEGIARERVILFRMLTQAWGNLSGGAREVFRGGLNSVRRFQQYEAGMSDATIDRAIQDRFAGAVGGRGGELHAEFERIRELLSTRRGKRVGAPQRRAFIADLRRRLTDACLDSLEPDLIILDEFQRFRDLLNPDTESGELAKGLFEYEDSHTRVRTLLLSATPYKMYTMNHETEDDHYRDFLGTVNFLEGREGSVEPLRQALHQFRYDLPQLAAGGETGAAAADRLIQHRARIECQLRRVMSRTERRGREAGGDPMLSIEDMGADLQVDDVEAYLSARNIAAQTDSPDVTEYWKSTPYLLSFMEQYRLATRVRDAVGEDPAGPVAELIRNSPHLQLNRNATVDREEIPGGNGRMRAFLNDLHDAGLYRLLWLPPSLSAYKLGPDFERARNATKRLVFSSWAMVPRAVAVMASYDAERRYIPDPGRADHRYEAQSLHLARDAHSLFALLVPSTTLADVGDPYRYEATGARELLEAIQERLRPMVSQITREAPDSGRPHQAWYAVAPLLLDGVSRRVPDWLQGPPVNTSRAELTDNGESIAWRQLLGSVERGLADPASLGRPPSDLLEVMASLAAGSPANATLRALSRITGTPAADDQLRTVAMQAAWNFRSFFRAPVSEGLLHNVYRPSVPVGRRGYWRRVLAYAIEGGLSDVLDEYFHVVSESHGGATDAAALGAALSEALHLAAGRLEVAEWKADDTGVHRQTYTMRQHFARRYASDRAGILDEQASERLDAVRRSFNSPFWPFVLATTSVGQEGLDFHWYCHAVVHWNLPPNPVDLEQREGRVHRYHGHAIRKNIAQSVGNDVIERTREATNRDQFASPWDEAYRLVDSGFASDGGLSPHWVFPKGNARIQRYAPVLPLSRDAQRVEALRRSLAVYRMVFGQPRQDDLVEFILREVPDERRSELAAALTIDLSPPA